MDSARFRNRTALVALGALALAAVLAGGCAAPKHSERATFGVVTGVVQDAQGNPINGAVVRVFQPTVGPDIVVASVTTGPNGVFTASVQAGRTVQVDATAPGFVTGVGRSADGVGATTFDVIDTSVLRVKIVLQPDAGSASTSIGPSGGSLGTQAANGFRVSFPPNAVASATTIRVFKLSGSDIPAPPDASLHALQVPAGTRSIASPLVALRIEPADLALSQAATVTVTLPIALTGTQVPLWWLAPNGQWVDAGFATLNSATQATFQTLAPAGPGGTLVPRLGSYMVSLTTTWTFGAPTSVSLADARVQFDDQVEGAVEDGGALANIPPLSSGQPYSVALPVKLTGFGAQPLLSSAFEAIAGQVANGFVREVVPGGGNIGLQCRLQSQTVTATSAAGSASGVRFFWNCTQVTVLAPVETVPPHFQGHGQGGGTGG